MKDQDSKQRSPPAPSQRSRPGRPEPSVNMDELRELIALLRDNGLSEFELEREGFRVRLRRGVDFEARESAPSSATAGLDQASAATGSAAKSVSGAIAGSPAAAATAKSSIPEDEDLRIIPSPIVGTFYRSRSP